MYKIFKGSVGRLKFLLIHVYLVFLPLVDDLFFYVGVLKVTDEKSSIRRQIR
jgi:hypothetical protein